MGSPLRDSDLCVNISDVQHTDVIQRAVIEGDLRLLHQLKEQGTNVLLDQQASELTALHFAAAAGRIDVLEFLLKSGADPKALRQNNFSTLHAAAMHGHTGIVDILGALVLVLQTEDAVAEYNRRVRAARVVAIVHSTC